MPVSVRITKIALLSAYNTAAAQGATLLAVLQANATGALPATLAGKQLMEAQADGVVSKYEFPTQQWGIQVQDVAEMWGRLLDLYAAAITSTTNIPPGGGCAAEVAGTPPNNSATTTAIYNWMLGQLTVVRSFSIDHSWSGIRP